nr:BTB/POZ and MATH domain-containing protein 2-like [Aegilops tauschii subsp. strangulata]
MADECKVSAVNIDERGSYLLKVDGHSRAKGLYNKGEYMASPPFSVGGHYWVMVDYPNGGDSEKHVGHNILVSLVLHSADAKDIKAQVKFCILDKDGLPVQKLGCAVADCIFPRKDSTCDYFVIRDVFERPEHIIDDCFSIRCDLTVIKNNNTLHQKTMVPPSDLHRHLGNLLESMDGGNVTFLVGGDKFLAHRVVLAARSSVFKAELLGVMKEKANNLVEIKEMEADVFRCLLHFIYTDSLPDLQNMASNQGEARQNVVMASHLLVAADRYNVERLKLICEHKLCSNIDTNMVATSLALAEQHSCKRLKEACLRFLASPSNLEAMMASDGYEHLKRSCPSALKELIASLLPDTMKAANDIIMEIYLKLIPSALCNANGIHINMPSKKVVINKAQLE